MTCAELALVLAGFSGIVSVFSRNGDRSNQQLRLAGLLASALGVLFFSLAPVTLSYLGLEPDHVWRISSAIMATYVAIGLVIFVPRALNDPETRARLPVFYLLWGSVGAIGLLQLANSLLLPNETRFGVYFAGVAWSLLAGGSFFCLFLLPPRSS